MELAIGSATSGPPRWFEMTGYAALALSDRNERALLISTIIQSDANDVKLIAKGGVER